MGELLSDAEWEAWNSERAIRSPDGVRYVAAIMERDAVIMQRDLLLGRNDALEERVVALDKELQQFKDGAMASLAPLTSPDGMRYVPEVERDAVIKERDAALAASISKDQYIAALERDLIHAGQRAPGLSVNAEQIAYYNRMVERAALMERERNEARSELFLARKEIAGLKSERHDALRRAAARRAG